MYAFAPSLKRASPQRRPAARKDPIILASALATVAGYLGYQGLNYLGDFLQWLYDQEAYWETKLFEAQATVDEAKQKLDAIAQAKAQAEAEAAQNPDDQSGGWL
jgi:hypothetical protein